MLRISVSVGLLLLVMLGSGEAALAAESPAGEASADGAPGAVDLSAEYRVRTVYVNSLELSGTRVGASNWTEQRMRVDLTLRHQSWFRIITRMDLLDGVLFGDNGVFKGDPAPISGVSIAAKRPNNTGWRVGMLDEGKGPVDRESYVPVLRGIEPLQIDRIYGEVVLPIGVLRVGRQPLVDGVGLAAHSGDTINRWGVSWHGDTADRFLFGTKLDEVVRRLSGGEGGGEITLNEGVFWALFVDRPNQGLPHVESDDLVQLGTAIQWLQPRASWLGADWRDLKLSVVVVHLRGAFQTRIYSVPVSFSTRIGPVSVLLQAQPIRGSTKEISEGFGALSPHRKPALQDIEAQAARAVIDCEIGPLTLTMEADYASGDGDPRPGGAIKSFSFPRDLNVGLLLFEHILAFETARSAAVGIENLDANKAASFPLTEVSTEGRFTNAIALFPQLKMDWLDTVDHQLHTRFGVLMAWPDGGVVDPILTILGDDGNEIDDDAVNFHGGRPGSYYGTELDLQLGWIYRGLFEWVVEGAVLFPGDALEDANTDAVPSFFLESRFVFRY